MSKADDGAKNDEKELEAALAGVGQQAAEGLQFEETPTIAPVASTLPPDLSAVTDLSTPTIPPTDATLPGAVTDFSAPTIPTVSPLGEAPTVPADLAPIKDEAINELRPLVDKLTLPPEEKFDTYLLLLRSTDDKSLIAPAHAAAREITDEAKKAQALLDIIKEIDYLSNPPQ